jgi:hypothetical protein
MRVGIVGGTDKNLQRYTEVAETAGCEVEFHDGRMTGRGPKALQTLVTRCDVVVVITRINSHGAVQQAQKHCRRHGRKALFVRRFGLRALADLARSQPEAPAGADQPRC